MTDIEVGARLAEEDLSDQLAARVEDLDTVASAGIHVTLRVAVDT